MKYMGSKSRISKHLVPILQEKINTLKIENYIEPFVGGANIIDKIICKNKIGYDKHEFLISLYQNLDKVDTLPAFITKEHYSDVRHCFNIESNSFEKWYIGAVGFLASYNGRFFDGGYAGIVKAKSGVVRNYYNEALRNLTGQSENLRGITWECRDYIELFKVDISNSVIYCDPPYVGTKQYGVSKNFDHKLFWNWVREMSKNNIVLVSEINAPDDFEAIWEQEVIRTIDNTKRVKSVEKLFCVK